MDPTDILELIVERKTVILSAAILTSSLRIVLLLAEATMAHNM